MALALFCRQSNKISKIKKIISIQISEYRIVKPNILYNNINRNSNGIKQHEIRFFSLTQPKYSKHNYAVHWKFERVLSLALFGIYPAAFLFPSTNLEYVLIVCTVTHIHLGLSSVVLDYIRPITFGKKGAKIAGSLLMIFTLSILVGLINFTRNDVGIVNAIKQFWALKGYNKTESATGDSGAAESGAKVSRRKKGAECPADNGTKEKKKGN